MTTTTDRHLTDAENAASLARFYGIAEHACYDPAAAVREIDAALAELTAARALLAEEVTA